MSFHQPMQPFYKPINVPPQSAPGTIVLHGNGHFRGERLASVPYRILALAVDLLIVYIVWKVFDLVVPERFTTLDGIADFLGFCVALSVAVANFVWLQSKTGQSIGKMLFGMVVVHPFVDPQDLERAFYAYPSVWTMAGRTMVHYFADLFFAIGLLFMAKSQRKESIADWCCNTIVLRPVNMDAVPIQRGVTGARDR